MKRLLGWFAENAVVANLIMFVIIVGGFMSALRMNPTITPDVDTGMISVSVLYPGASPAEVEESICVKIEEEIESLDGIKRLTSLARESVGIVTAELDDGVDTHKLLGDVKTRVDAIDTFPADAEEPVIEQDEVSREVVAIAVSGRTDEASLRAVSEDLRDRLTAIPDIGKVVLRSVRPYEITIAVSEAALRKYRLTFDEVAAAVKGSSLDLPGGLVKTEGKQILLRSLGQGYVGRDFESIAVRTHADGSRVTLADVAHVTDGFEETELLSSFDEEPATLLQVLRVGDQSALDIARKAKAFVADAQTRVPEGISITVWRDNSFYLRGRLELLVSNGIIGLILVFISLTLFLKVGMALWVALGIPLSFLGALWVMPSLDVSINLISLFGFIVVLGIVVDDAIVIGERIYTKFQRGMSPLEAAKEGVYEVSLPVVFAVLTTIAAFAPMIGLPGNMGQFARNIPLVVIACLCFSLVEALLILPAHLRHLKRDRPARGLARAWRAFQGFFSRGLTTFVAKVYAPLLDRCLAWRYLTVAFALGILAMTVGIFAGGHIKFTFFPEIEADNVAAMLAMPQGTPTSETLAAIRKLEASAERIRSEVDAAEGGDKPSIFKHVMSTVGRQPFREMQNQHTGDFGPKTASSSVGEVTIELAPPELRAVGASEIERRWRELSGSIAGVRELSFTSSLMASEGDIDVQFSALELAHLVGATARLEDKLRSYPGISDITDSFEAGKEEVQLRMKPAGEALGLRMADLARQVRQAFYGEEAQRVQRGRDDVKVMVRYPIEERRSLAALENLRIRTREGAEVPLDTVADVGFGRGFAEIQRVDRHRTVNVRAKVDTDVANANEILAELKKDFLPGLAAAYPGLSYDLEGKQRDQREMLRAMMQSFILAIFIIYAMLAIPFRSYVQPLIVLSVVPFGVVGAVLGHILLGMDLTMMSLIGLIALAGVVVNDSLVVVDFVNRARRSGVELVTAIREAGQVRFRPIILTSLTTFAGLTPMLFETSLQARFLIPTAVSLAFGVVFATLLTLLLVPCSYLVLEDLRALFVREVAGGEHEPRALPGTAEAQA